MTYEGLTADGKCIKCGNDKFKMLMHLDFNDRAETSYECTECGNNAFVIEERDWKWGDE